MTLDWSAPPLVRPARRERPGWHPFLGGFVTGHPLGDLTDQLCELGHAPALTDATTIDWSDGPGFALAGGPEAVGHLAANGRFVA